MPTLSASYGACYTYNSKLNPFDSYASLRKSSLTGPFFGLSLVLNLEQQTYLKAGITKQVHRSPLELIGILFDKISTFLKDSMVFVFGVQTF